MSDHSVDDVAHVYAYIHDQAHLAAYLLLSGDHPLGLLQTYDPAVDEIGRWYDRAPGDVGVHLLLADDPRRAGRTREVIAAGLDLVAHLPGCRRLVFEPDSRNTAFGQPARASRLRPRPIGRAAHERRGEAGAVLLLDRERALVLARR
ncbi:GNAT family N-acetyltransferase [Nocardioides kongjuensis]|uniref:GNAT family N-acetyltransferase n=1 Tax=Nocardioides kongjuensis TaxID=349522 RepID=UPI0031EA89D7